MQSLTVRTGRREDLVNITGSVRQMAQEMAAAAGRSEGALILFCPHTTCGLTINEGADPDVARDMVSFLHRLIPCDAEFRHAEGNADAHIKASLFGASLHLLISEGELRLGTWQAVYLFEGDGPRTRTVWLSFV